MLQEKQKIMMQMDTIQHWQVVAVDIMVEMLVGMQTTKRVMYIILVQQEVLPLFQDTRAAMQ